MTLSSDFTRSPQAQLTPAKRALAMLCVTLNCGALRPQSLARNDGVVWGLKPGSAKGSRSIDRRLCRAIAHVLGQSCTRNLVLDTSQIDASRRAKT